MKPYYIFLNLIIVQLALPNLKHHLESFSELDFPTAVNKDDAATADPMGSAQFLPER